MPVEGDANMVRRKWGFGSGKVEGGPGNRGWRPCVSDSEGEIAAKGPVAPSLGIPERFKSHVTFRPGGVAYGQTIRGRSRMGPRFSRPARLRGRFEPRAGPISRVCVHWK